MMVIRIFDVLISFISLLILSPLLLFVGITLRLTGEGYVFYAQDRVGFRGQLFRVLKFATMLRDSPKLGAGLITLERDDRVLPFGRLLRKTKLNELPQLINVLKGDLSLVGPRPIVPEQFSQYSAREQNELFSIQPGLSGLGSLIFRDEERLLSQVDNPREFHQKNIGSYKVELSNWYADNRTLGTYFYIIFLTVWIILFPRSTLVWKLFPKMPRPSNDELRQLLGIGQRR